MRDDAQLIHSILHGDPNYNPAKAREYYLRTRELKGRNKARDEPKGAPQLRVGASQGGQGGTPKVGSANAPTKAVAKVGNINKIAAARQAGLAVRMRKLNDVLEKLVAKAKERRGDSEAKSSEDAKASSDKSSKAAKDSPTLSPKQKREAADRASKSYEKNKKLEPKEKTLEQLDDQIADVRERIQKVKVDLKATLENARPQSVNQSKTAPKGR